MNPFEILAQLTPRARSEEELIDMAAQLSPPPVPNFAPPVNTAQLPQSGASGFAQVPAQRTGAVITPPMPLPITPPQTVGESRTRIGQYL